MVKKILVGSGFKMRKSVKDSIEYTKVIHNFIKENSFALEPVEVFILASFEALYPMSELISKSGLIKLGAQDCWHEDTGAYTGEVSPKNLKEIGCTYVEVGHPERRDMFGEDSTLINRKIKACIRNDLKPMLFIGERKRSADKKDAHDFLEKQLQKELSGLDRKDISDVVLAYEPVWAIGAKEAAPPDYIQDSLVFLRKYFNSNFGPDTSGRQFIFYGGSVRLDNAKEILKIRGNDGISSGRGAMDPQYFIKMIKIASKISDSC